MSPSPQEQKLEVLKELVAIVSDADNAKAKRGKAKQALCKIGDERVVALLEERARQSADETILTDIVEILTALSPAEEALVALIRLVWHDWPQVRRQAIRALGQKGDWRVARLLEQVITASADPQSIFEEEDARLAEEACQRIEARLGE